MSFEYAADMHDRDSWFSGRDRSLYRVTSGPGFLRPRCYLSRLRNSERIRCTKTRYRLIGCNHKIRLSLKLGIITHDLLFASHELETSVSLASPSLTYRIGIFQNNVHFDSAPIHYTLQCMALCVHLSNLSFDLHLDSISRQCSIPYHSPLGGRFRPLLVRQLHRSPCVSCLSSSCA